MDNGLFNPIRSQYVEFIFGNDFNLKKKKSIDKVVFENNYCIIVYTNGDRYIARPEKGEKFDKEKGLLVALAKYCGFTTTKIHNLLEGAIEKNAKTKKPAKKS